MNINVGFASSWDQLVDPCLEVMLFKGIEKIEITEKWRAETISS